MIHHCGPHNPVITVRAYIYGYFGGIFFYMWLFEGIFQMMCHNLLLQLFTNGVSVSGRHKEAAYVHVIDFRRLKHGAISGQTPSQFLST